MVYKLLESPIFILLQNDISVMAEYFENFGKPIYDLIADLDSDLSSPTIGIVRFCNFIII